VPRFRSKLTTPVLPLTALADYVLIPLVLFLGADMIVHGHLTPGGGSDTRSVDRGGTVVRTRMRG
jgi:hypothetical protein